MKLYELINEVDWCSVKQSLIKEYHPSDYDLDSYMHMLFRLKSIEPTDSKNMRICIDWVDESKDERYCGKSDEKYWHVGGKDGTLNKESEDFKYFKDTVTEEFANSEISYAIEFCPFSQWLDMEIDNETANKINLTKADIVAHSMWEMSFISFNEEEIQDNMKELENRCIEIKNMSDEELKKNTVSMEELRENLKKRIKDIDL